MDHDIEEGNNDLMTIEQAARQLKMSINRIRYELYLKRIPHLKIGRSIRFSRLQLNIWICNHEKNPMINENKTSIGGGNGLSKTT
jgi:excisionase family DNA binding protein